MRSILDYLNLTETERKVLEGLLALPPDLFEQFQKMLNGNTKEFKEAEKEVLAIIEERKRRDKTQ